MRIEYRLAQLTDAHELEELISASSYELQAFYYSRDQIEGAIGTVFGVDTQLIKDGTYFIAAREGKTVGCGGWSKRRTTYGSDRTKKYEDTLRDPKTEPAMIRAFFVRPAFARCGIGREFVRLSEEAALAAGFSMIEIVATLAGEPLYAACGYTVLERFEIELENSLKMPVVRMQKTPNNKGCSQVEERDLGLHP